MKKRMLLLFALLLICIPGPATLAEGFTVSDIQSPEGRQEIFCSIVADSKAYLLSVAKSLYELDLETRQATPLPLRQHQSRIRVHPCASAAFSRHRQG